MVEDPAPEVWPGPPTSPKTGNPERSTPSAVSARKVSRWSFDGPGRSPVYWARGGLHRCPRMQSGRHVRRDPQALCRRACARDCRRQPRGLADRPQARNTVGVLCERIRGCPPHGDRGGGVPLDLLRGVGATCATCCGSPSHGVHHQLPATTRPVVDPGASPACTVPGHLERRQDGPAGSCSTPTRTSTAEATWATPAASRRRRGRGPASGGR